MTNPWLQIPASDYEGHMGSPDVAQLSFLAQTFKESLEKYGCSTVALLGCATGNGLEFINKHVTRKLTAVDMNPEYLDILRQRYGNSIPGLETVEAELESYPIENNAYSLIFTGLVFEYLNPRRVLPKIARGLCLDGVLVAVLQLPAKALKKVSDTPYRSLKKLNSIMNLISPDEFKIMAGESGLKEREAMTVTLESGKPFYVGTYERG